MPRAAETASHSVIQDEVCDYHVWACDHLDSCPHKLLLSKNHGAGYFYSERLLAANHSLSIFAAKLAEIISPALTFTSALHCRMTESQRRSNTERDKEFEHLSRVLLYSGIERGFTQELRLDELTLHVPKSSANPRTPLPILIRPIIITAA